MTETLIDANVVISFLYRRAPEQQKRAARLFESAVTGQATLLLHQHVIAETIYVLLNVYECSVEEVSEISSDLIDMPGTRRIDGLVDARLFELWPDKITDFGDAVIGAVAMEKNCRVATFDQGFLESLDDLGVEIHRW